MSNKFDIWFAGFFDGEGSIHKAKYSRGLQIGQALNSERPVKKFYKVQLTNVDI